MMVIIARIKVVIVINILTHIAISHVSMELPICCGTLRCETQGKSSREKPIAKDLEPITPDQIRIIVMSANVAEKIAMNDKCVNHNGITSFSS